MNFGDCLAVEQEVVPAPGANRKQPYGWRWTMAQSFPELNCSTLMHEEQKRLRKVQKDFLLNKRTTMTTFHESPGSWRKNTVLARRKAVPESRLVRDI